MEKKTKIIMFSFFQGYPNRVQEEVETKPSVNQGLGAGVKDARLHTMSTQTSEGYVIDEVTIEQEMGGRPPMNQNLASLYHGAWPMQDKGTTSKRLNRRSYTFFKFLRTDAASWLNG
jgi:hypothetical protein